MGTTLSCTFYMAPQGQQAITDHSQMITGVVSYVVYSNRIH